VGGRTEHEGGPPAPGRGGDHVQARLQAEQRLVDVGVAGGGTGHRQPRLLPGLDQVEGLVQGGVEVAHRVGQAVLGHGEDQALGLVDDAVDVVG
jgi:hypothetical protein